MAFWRELRTSRRSSRTEALAVQWPLADTEAWTAVVIDNQVAIVITGRVNRLREA